MSPEVNAIYYWQRCRICIGLILKCISWLATGTQNKQNVFNRIYGRLSWGILVGSGVTHNSWVSSIIKTEQDPPKKVIYRLSQASQGLKRSVYLYPLYALK